MKCPICGEVVYKDRNYQSGEYVLFHCEECKLSFIYPLPTQEEIRNYYNTAYHHSKISKVSYLAHKDTDRISKIIKKINPYARSIIEIGCGYGNLLYGLKMEGYEVKGYELSKETAEEAHKIFGLDVEIGSPLEKKNVKYDVLIIRHVLEHLLEPFNELKGLRNVLKSDGLLILVVPNFNSLSFKFLKKRHKWYDPPAHVYYFNKNSLKSLLTALGFTLYKAFTRLGDYDNLFLGFYAGIRNKASLHCRRHSQINRDNIPIKTSMEKTTWRAIISSIAKISEYILYPIQKLLDSTGLGEELWVIAKKE